MRVQRLALLFVIFMNSCSTPGREVVSERKEVKLITIDPGHFHAALIQKTLYPDVDSVVHVYAPQGNDLDLHLSRVRAYNNRIDSPTNWNEIIYTGPDFLDRAIKEKKGNVVVLAGNNQK